MYSCEFCPLKFKYLRNLDRHKLSHRGRKPVFSCQTCGKKYTSYLYWIFAATIWGMYVTRRVSVRPSGAW